MKKNIGHRLGRLIKKYRNWQHPRYLKWFYALITSLTIGYILIAHWGLSALFIAFIILKFAPEESLFRKFFTAIFDVYTESESKPNKNTGSFNEEQEYYEELEFYRRIMDDEF